MIRAKKETLRIEKSFFLLRHMSGDLILIFQNMFIKDDFADIMD